MHRLRSLKDILKKYMFILTPSQKRWGLVVVIMTLIGAVCELMGVSIILPLAQVMLDPQQLKKNMVMESIINVMGLDSDTELIFMTGAAVIIVYVIKNVFLLMLSYVRIKYACKIERELSVEMMSSYMKRGYVFFLNMNTGELLRGMQGNITNTYVALNQVFMLFAEMMTICFICIYIMSTDVIMALCVGTLAIVCLTFVVLVCQKKVKKCGEIYYTYSALIGKTIIQTFQGIKEVLVMRRQKYFVNEYQKNFIKQQKGTIGRTVASESPTYLIETICVAGLIVTVCIKAINVEDASVLIPQLASFAVAAFRILPSLGRMSNYFNQFMFCIPGINDTYTNFKEARNNQEIQQERTNNIKDSELGTFDDRLSLNDITWRYPNTSNNVLENVSMEIKKGESIAFVGKSGAGKTTLADIILGLLKPQKGTVKIDEANIEEIPEKRSRIIGFVPQNVNLLDDTVRRNVAFGIKDEEIDDEKVWNALEQAQLKDIIEGYEKGIDTEIGERGIRFSGGQRQRFAIARALYYNPEILVLDEATSALDTETETSVMEAIESLQGHKTLIIIAHRLTTIRNCDKIYEIANGKAVERKYEELV
ncbi:hypothetical protein C819_02995 [Lachnospiraceae bacterium 10-1]|nr:hypothetical protein C819_02995 [Lachnospiraceae bacterium 10-1]